MKFFLALVGLLAVASANVPGEITTAYNYHARFGIQKALEIKQAEAALDFDGSRIVGGKPSALGDHPHLGGLHIYLTNGWESVCGSSLISNTKLVTAAHCWSDGSNQARQFTVVLGSRYLFFGGTRINTNNVVLHPQWNSYWVLNDVAVITIRHVAYTDNIKPIALASGSNLYVGTVATAVGYGATSDSVSGIGTGAFRSEVDVTVVANSVCRNVYGSSILDSTLCVGTTGGKGTCGGDSGGPLSIGSGDGKTLIGITSFGHKDGCEKDYPAGFARVTYFEYWIRGQI